MTNTITLKMWTAGLMAAIALTAGYWTTEENDMMAFAEKKADLIQRLPLIDQRAPGQTETATFALG